MQRGLPSITAAEGVRAGCGQREGWGKTYISTSVSFLQTFQALHGRTFTVTVTALAGFLRTTHKHEKGVCCSPIAFFLVAAHTFPPANAIPMSPSVEFGLWPKAIRSSIVKAESRAAKVRIVCRGW